jgi:hypothetical protein
VLGKGLLPGFEEFLNQVGEFLAFKSLPLPEGVKCEVVVSSFATPDTTGGTAPHRPRLWGGINLGDEVPRTS